MKDIDRAEFAGLFTDLVVNLGPQTLKTNDGLQQKMCVSYFDALRNVPMQDVRAGAQLLIQSSRFFPKPVDWRSAAQRTRKPVAPVLPPPVLLEDGTVEQTRYCARCDDTGWVPNCGCPMDSLGPGHKCRAHPFERYGLVYPNPLEPCLCRPGNPYWQANHTVRYAEASKPTERE